MSIRNPLLLTAVLVALGATGCGAAGTVADDDPQSPMVKKMTSGASAIRAANLYKADEEIGPSGPELKLTDSEQRQYTDVVFLGDPNAMSLPLMRGYRDAYEKKLKKVRAAEEKARKIMRRLKSARLGGVYTADRAPKVVEFVESWNDLLAAQAKYTAPKVKMVETIAAAAYAAQDSLNAAIDYREGRASRSSYRDEVQEAYRAYEKMRRALDDYEDPSAKALARAARAAELASGSSPKAQSITDAVQRRFGASLAIPE